MIATTIALALFAAAVIAATAWLETLNRRVKERHDAEDAADAVVFGPRVMWGANDTYADADAMWNGFMDVVDARAMPISTSPVARRIRERIADGECRRFRDELDEWGGGAAS